MVTLIFAADEVDCPPWGSFGACCSSGVFRSSRFTCSFVASCVTSVSAESVMHRSRPSIRENY